MACRTGKLLLVKVLVCALLHDWTATAKKRSTKRYTNTCPGPVNIEGVGELQLVASKWQFPMFPSRAVKNEGGRVEPEMWGRAYMANNCSQGVYKREDAATMKLLGKSFSFTTDVSRSGCGCNAALYLVSMAQNNLKSLCRDYYCDAKAICAVRCHEVDIMEANRYAFHSTLHKSWDNIGVSAGYGGFTSQFFNGTQYGPDANCINTNKPFTVSTAFPVNQAGKLLRVDVTLEQNGCTQFLRIEDYPRDHNLDSLSDALTLGMTPVISYWGDENMQWLDGTTINGEQGPCAKDQKICDKAPKFSDFRVEDIGASFKKRRYNFRSEHHHQHQQHHHRR